MKQLVIFCHPSMESFCNALAERYCAGAQDAGNDIRRINIGEIAFDPVLRQGYAHDQPLESDLVMAQETILWADHLVFVYPTWWAAPPAVLKAFIERVFLPGFAFKYKESRKIVAWDKLLQNKSARVISTMDSPPLYYKMIIGDPGYKMMKDIMNFCGIRPVAQTYVGSVKLSSPAKRQDWLEGMYRIGSRS
ncbi:Putative NADPH-quinone reductase (modulator of drug activity B) [Alkalispirochaeta americana]|uniref:Putative NADPH-quinone reductase (Modulator of drug activity B) n=1 Tax=Alkalispirochaeta americana TaxID=159291 RepID=A0A1N6PXN0_9SPIO|nr:NAD(P)H-dependent oxidoreductase [Alkalispirochaeta americana]SIQ09154.1 Putative NADPH-quinone reductase (modulator of drug activity B) [Alkalispirochaeta americana]